MASNQPFSGKPRKVLNCSLNYPRIGNLVDLSDFWFYWTAPETRELNISYQLEVYQLRPGESFTEAVKGKPVYMVEKVKAPYHKYPEQSQKLDRQLAYCWKIEIHDDMHRVIGISEIQGFRFLPERTYNTLDSSMVPCWRDDRSLFLPPPPIIWGCPVLLRGISSVPDEEPTDEEPGTPGTTDPLLFTLWGAEAARLYLVPSLVRHSTVRWNYSHITGCEQVLLQIVGPDGFEIPNTVDAQADTGILSWYLGPVTIDTEEWGSNPPPRLAFLGEQPPNYHADDLNLQRTGSGLPLLIPLEHLFVRLAPLDAAGNQIGPASDHISVNCEEYPRIDLESCEGEWLWGDPPRRRIHFTIRLRGVFPSTVICGEARATFIIYTYENPYSDIPHVYDPDRVSVSENVSLTKEDGSSVNLLGVQHRAGIISGETLIENLPAYFVEIDQWVDNATHTFTLEQVCYPLANSSIVAFLSFIETELIVKCIPGLSPNWQINQGCMLDGFRPPIGSTDDDDFCANPSLSRSSKESGLDSIYNLFASPLTGRRVSSMDGDQEIQVYFEFPEVISDALEFRRFLCTGQSFTMVENISGSIRTYEFRSTGFHALMYFPDIHGERYGGEDAITPGHLIYDPPRLEMYFQCDRSHWIDAEARWVEDIETVEYYLSIEE